MCGIFGFILNNPVPMDTVFQILKKLEGSQYPDETVPVGGYGAGVAIMLKDGNIIAEKVGKTIETSPVAELAKTMTGRLAEASVLLGHVRFPSDELMGTVNFREAAQPYVENFEPELTIVSVHNGRVQNFAKLKAKLKKHIFESNKIGFVDSEVIPHYFGKMLNEAESVDAAVYELWCALKGSNTVALLQLDDENAFLHLIHKGKTNGLVIWTNNRDEVMFCSRREPVEEELKMLLAIGKFKEKVSIKHEEDVGLKLSFPVPF